MDRTDLELSRLRWRISMLQALVVDAYAGWASLAASAHPGSPNRAEAQDIHSKILAVVEAAHQRGTQEILTSSDPEKLLLAQEFARVVQEMKASLALLVRTSLPKNI